MKTQALRLILVAIAAGSLESNVEAQTAPKDMARRSSRQQQFLFDYLKDHPDRGSSPVERFDWMNRAEQAYAVSVQGTASAGADPASRLASFSPYVWSWLPMFVAEGEPSSELTERTHVDRVLPALLADLEAVVDEREEGARELLRIPDLGNGLGKAELLARVDVNTLERFRSSIGRLPDVVAGWRQSTGATGSSLPRHLNSAVRQLNRYARLIEIELGLRGGSLEQVQAQLSAMATPGALPSGFESLVERLARGYRDAQRPGAALAVLDLGMLSTTEGSWPASQLRSLYESYGGRLGAIRFELAMSRRAAPLVRSSLRFDAATLTDIETGKPLDARALKGRTLILDFTQRNCGPCQQAVPKLQQFDEEHPELVVLGVVVGPAADRDVVVKDTRTRGGRYPLHYGPEDLAERLGVLGYPSFVVVTPDGAVLRPFGVGSEATHMFEDVVGTLVPGGWQYRKSAR